MKLDWDKEAGDWRVYDESGVLLARAAEIVIEGTTVLVNDARNRHGWAVTSGKIEQKQPDRIVIRKE
jgi:hypothetical protein